VVTVLGALWLVACFTLAFVVIYKVGVARGRELERARRNADVDRLLGITPAEDAAPTGGLNTWDF
jgi:hypothetical protein